MFDNAVNGRTKLDWTSFQRLMLKDVIRSKIIESGYIAASDWERIRWAIEHPKQGYHVLLNTSEMLMRISPHYYRLNTYFGNMAKIRWGIDLYDLKDKYNVDNLKSCYNSLASRLEKMNLAHEFGKILSYLPYQDVYCGLIFETKDDFFIQKIDYNICKLYELQDGIYNFCLDLSAINALNITAYPEYVQKAYSEYLNTKNDDKGKNLTSWYLPPPDKQICIKLNEQFTYPFPMLIGMVKDIFDLDVYKLLKLQSARTDNYKAIAVKIPFKQDTLNAPLISPDFIRLFTQMNCEILPDDVGLIYTPAEKGEAISFKDSANTRNNVRDSTDGLYDDAGVSREMFNGSSSGTAVTFSVENDSAVIYRIYRQFERWVNRYIKLKRLNRQAFKFKFYLLDTTVFNINEVMKGLKDQLSLGAPVVDRWLYTMGLTPSTIPGSYALHKDIFDFTNNLIPLSSTYNSSDVSERGRPTNEESGKRLTEKGEITKDSGANEDR